MNILEKVKNDEQCIAVVEQVDLCLLWESVVILLEKEGCCLGRLVSQLLVDRREVVVTSGLQVVNCL